MRVILLFIGIGLLGLSAAGLATAPKIDDASVFEGLTADLAQGEVVFNAAGCASCHAAPDAEGAARLVLAGGRAFPSDFGTFYAPNISPDPVNGIGDWEPIALLNAMRYGTSPDRKHYYPAFPYGSYAAATTQDILSLYGYMMSLPAVSTPSRPHDVSIPFNIRLALGGWKLLFQPQLWIVQDAPTPELERGRYLVEALGHCSECHTSRNQLGGPVTDKWLAGAPSPDGKGRIPDITPTGLGWSVAEIADYLETGFTPDFDTVGGQMVEVVENTSRLSPEDRRAIAVYLTELPTMP